ncbi:MAG: CotH kinase family protein, partial [Eubacteriales bacterium]|nr:CotH kinase family protein [Eubacteriales bacterium]
MKKEISVIFFILLFFPLIISCNKIAEESESDYSEQSEEQSSFCTESSFEYYSLPESDDMTESQESLESSSVSETSEDFSDTVTEQSSEISEEPEISEVSYDESSTDESSTEEIEKPEITSIVLKKKNNPYLKEDIVFEVNTQNKTISSSFEFTYAQNTDLYFTITHNGERVENGKEPIDEKNSFLLWRSNKITVVGKNNLQTVYTVSLREKNYGLPVVYINTDSGKSVGKYDDYVNGSVSVFSKKGANLYGKPMKIRVRGNSTRTHPKLSYRIKLDEKSGVLGMGSAKNWVLLANHSDKSLMRNLCAFYLAEQFSGITYTPSMQFAEVYLNNEYIGVYTIGDHLQVQENRVDIEEGSSKTDTGYFLECDVRAAEEDRRYFEVSGMLFSVLSPKPATDDQFDYISSYVQRIDKMLRNRDERVWNFLDMKSCADWLLAKEICGATGMGYDAYMYKDKGGKLYFGPVWDYDLAFGNADFGGAERYDRFYLCSGQWMALWLEYDSFRSVFLKRWEEAKSTYIPAMINKMWEYYELCNAADAHNFERWDILNTYVWPNPPKVMQANTFKKQVEYLEWYVNKHT